MTLEQDDAVKRLLIVAEQALGAAAEALETIQQVVPADAGIDAALQITQRARQRVLRMVIFQLS